MQNPKEAELNRVAYSEALFRELFQHMSSCVAVYAAIDGGDDFIFLDFNRSAEVLDKLEREAVIGKRLTDCFPGVKEFGFLPILKRVWKTGQPQHFPASYYEDSRITGWRENYVYRLPTGEVVAIYDDVTRRKQAEFDLRESHEKLDLLLNSMAEGAYGVDTDGMCTFVNKSFMQILGFESTKEIIGKHIHGLIHHSHADGRPYPATECRMYAAYQRHQDIHVSDEVFWRKDGTSIPVEYWSKPILRDDVVVGAIATFLDITERKKQEALVRELAFHDPLTQLPNRRLLDDRLNQSLAASKRSERYGAVMYIDLDNFKPLNDSHGHAVGDLLLVEVARRLTSCLRAVDTVARIGGDEFVVLVSELSKEKTEATGLAMAISEKIRVALAAPYLLNPEAEDRKETQIEHHCTSSIGVSLFINRDANHNEILKQSDAAMYQAKEAGRNRVRFYEHN
ncbi:MAG: sensor domain-containing diguanylate cyclase [Nitrosomonadales bacterium]|nr:sensor domain-containing diguanylate cyclase [Nitrosomonadales bacterium]